MDGVYRMSNQVQMKLFALIQYMVDSHFFNLFECLN